MKTRLLVLLASFALVSYVYYYSSDPRVVEQAFDAATPVPQAVQEEADIYLSDAKIIEYQPDGALKYRLHAQKMDHFNDTELTRMRAPQLAMRNANGTPWEITAISGTMQPAGKFATPSHPKLQGPTSDDEDLVHLDDGVVMRQNEREGLASGLTIRSEEIYIYPDRQYAETDTDVMIDSSIGRTHASGMNGDLNTGILQLHSQVDTPVHTIVLPHQFKAEDNNPTENQSDP